MKLLSELKVKLFADGAHRTGILEMYRKDYIRGFTTNPTLMRRAGITHYKSFALELLQEIKDKPISFEVFADEFSEMYSQAIEMASWGENVYVKIPVMNTQGIPTTELIRKLAHAGVKQNVTALMSLDQVSDVTEALADGPSAYISVLAGRIADTGRDPMPIIRSAVKIMKPYPQLELIWASPRELFNVFQADEMGCHIITATPDILNKLNLIGKDLMACSLEVVTSFRQDAVAAGFVLAEK